MDHLQRLVVEKLDIESEDHIGNFKLVCKAWRDLVDTKRSVYHSYLRNYGDQVVESKLSLIGGYRHHFCPLKVSVSLHVRFPEFEGMLYGLHCTFSIRSCYWTDMWVRVRSKSRDWQDKLSRIQRISKRHNMPMYVLFETQTMLDKFVTVGCSAGVRCSIHEFPQRVA